jgi:hypothetical protein
MADLEWKRVRKKIKTKFLLLIFFEVKQFSIVQSFGKLSERLKVMNK